MLKSIQSIFSKLNEPETSLSHNELQQASAVLLVHAAYVDGTAAPEEMDTIKKLLSEKYNLSGEEITGLIKDAEEKEQHSADLYSFTRILTSHLDQDGRKEIISMLWEIVLADGIIDNYEEHLVRRVSELIGVSTRDRVMLRKEVENR